MIKQMSDACYFAHPALNQSKFKDFLDLTPREFKYKQDNPSDKVNIDFVLGRMVHCLKLEPDEFPPRYCLYNETKGLDTKKAREFIKHLQPGVDIYTPDMHVQACGMVDSIEDIYLPAQAQRELAGFNTIGEIPCKAKADWIGDDGWINDLKTSSELDRFEHTWKRKWNYHIQAWWYLQVFREMDPQGFRFWPVGKSEPHDWRCFEVGADTLNEAEDLILPQLERYKICLETDTWPGYDKSPIEI